ncbi:hypothetical transmembrane protein [Mucinivorans hirudinis]|uniref:Hypothetical transmembrane protein n=1 Tax=Mucinivorans hirudinis TaxID=1433126 RepID=A0A060RD62_9BACT|nr:hypothetical transmembrane protein [Mucinivorans hirudinis]
MRPVKKWQPNDDSTPVKILEDYIPYQKAKEDLVKNIGDYCSYCERKLLLDTIHIEHIKCRELYLELETKWTNLLLSCPTCNGTKRTKEVKPEQTHLPDRDNTLLSFSYLEGGVIVVNSSLPETEQSKAKNLIELVGLDRRPGHPKHTSKDKRWEKRMEIWEYANRYIENDTQTIIDLATLSGCWSIWYNVFKDNAQVRKLLIEKFPGTNRDCFNESGEPTALDRDCL